MVCDIEIKPIARITIERVSPQISRAEKSVQAESVPEREEERQPEKEKGEDLVSEQIPR